MYVGTVICLLGLYSNQKGRLATAHWIDKRGVLVTYQSEEISTFLDLRGKIVCVEDQDPTQDSGKWHNE